MSLLGTKPAQQETARTTTPTHGITLQKWEELPFQNFLVNRLAILDIEDEHGQPGDAAILCIDYQPGFFVNAHKHRTGHVELILDGDLKVGDQWEHKGDIRVVPAGVTYGPIQAGPDGCKGMEFFADRKDILPILEDHIAAQPNNDATQVNDALARLLKINTEDRAVPTGDDLVRSVN
jgi:hypothetical protein